MKKFIAMVLIVCACIVMQAVPTFAKEVDSAVSENTVTRALYYRTASANLEISASGIAKATGKISGYEGVTTKTTVHLYLQQYAGGEWTDVDDWLCSENAADCALTESKQVDKGYKYRTKASCYAYADSKVEHVTKYSAEVWYR